MDSYTEHMVRAEHMRLKLAGVEERYGRFTDRNMEAARELTVRLYVTHRRLTWNKRRLSIANALRTRHSRRSRHSQDGR